MANYGLRIRDNTGNIVLDITDKISRFRYSNSVTAGSSSNITLSDISGLSTVEFAYPIEEVYNKCAHLIARDVTTINWTAQSGVPGPYYSTASVVFVFLYT